MFHEPDESWALHDSTDEAGQTVRLVASEGWFSALRRFFGDGAWRMPLMVFVVGFAVIGAFAGKRLLGPSTDPHFVYLANVYNSMAASTLGFEDAAARRDGKVPFELEKSPPHRNDWASYWEIKLRDGEVHRGTWIDKQGSGRFKLLGKNEALILQPKDLRGATRSQRYFVSFPPGPAVLMMPLAAVWDYRVNDVLFTVFFAALNMALMFILLRRLSRGGRTGRGRSDVLWLTAFFGFGTAHLWCAVLGQVWFTALIVGVTFTLLYMLCAIDARHPLLAGLFCGLAFATRTPLVFASIFFYLFVFFPGGRLLRRDGWGEAAKKLALFSIPCILIGLSLLAMNKVRFEQWSEFGHRYLAGGTLANIQNYGLFNFHFLARNLDAMFTLIPRFRDGAPYIEISKHGLSVLLTSPALLWLLRPLKRESTEDKFWHRALWATVAAVALPTLIYQNTGYEQFGYRFLLDYLPYLVVLLAVGRRPLGWAFKSAVLVGIAVNAFGAVTFKRFPKFYVNEFFSWIRG